MTTGLILTVCFVITSSPWTIQASDSYLGKHFIFGVLPAFDASLAYLTNVSLDIGSKDAGNLYLDVPFLGIYNATYAIKAGGYANIELDRSILWYHTGKENRSVQITSTSDISVLVTLVYHGCCGMASYRVYPVDVLGKLYAASAYTPYTSYATYIMVVAIKNKTNVFINLPGDPKNITLNALEMYYYKTPASITLTGTLIFSNETTAVFSGSGYSKHSGFSHGAPLLSQMIPKKSWARTFIVPEGESSKYLIIRMLSDNPTVCIDITDSASTRQTCRQSDDIMLHGNINMVTSAQPIVIVQYHDNCMTTVPGVSQYMSEYSFVIPTIKRTSLFHSIKAIVSSQYSDGLLLDGKPLVGVAMTLATPYGQFSTIQTTIQEGFHVVAHKIPNVKFGLLAFGQNDDTHDRFAYGFYVGMTFAESLSTSTTTSTVQTSRTTSSSYTVTTTAQTSTSAKSTTQSLVTASSKASRMCYSCHDMDQLQYCNGVRNCSADEVCFVDRHVVVGVPMYSSGCIDSSLCQARIPSNPRDSCTECCTDDFCNSRGCGDTGLPSRQQRGPVCFDCQHISSPALCPTLTLCDDGELCSIEEFKWGHSLQYRLGCFSKTCTRTKRSDPHMPGHDLRSVPVRHSCCGTDYCNRNVSHLDTGFIGTPGLIG